MVWTQRVPFQLCVKVTLDSFSLLHLCVFGSHEHKNKVVFFHRCVWDLMFRTCSNEVKTWSEAHMSLKMSFLLFLCKCNRWYSPSVVVVEGNWCWKSCRRHQTSSITVVFWSVQFHIRLWIWCQWRLTLVSYLSFYTLHTFNVRATLCQRMNKVMFWCWSSLFVKFTIKSLLQERAGKKRCKLITLFFSAYELCFTHSEPEMDVKN